MCLVQEQMRMLPTFVVLSIRKWLSYTQNLVNPFHQQNQMLLAKLLLQQLYLLQSRLPLLQALQQTIVL
uniref:Alternative protein ZFR n=1 Tax=Homo sapiens TaxID=9606 RepID=L0R5H8_HUMAN|nr:alternative protein ZFR [Homo sapiens]